MKKRIIDQSVKKGYIMKYRSGNFLSRFIEAVRRLFANIFRRNTDDFVKETDQNDPVIISPENQEKSQYSEPEIFKEKKHASEQPPSDTTCTSDSSKARFSPEFIQQFRSEPHTSSSAFRIPILQALENLGGSGRRKEVFGELEIIMADQLNENDRKILPANRYLTRWQKNAMHTRTKLLNEDYISADPKQGIWMITEKGKEYLKS
jgi:hypothetical protein